MCPLRCGETSPAKKPTSTPWPVGSGASPWKQTPMGRSACAIRRRRQGGPVSLRPSRGLGGCVRPSPSRWGATTLRMPALTWPGPGSACAATALPPKGPRSPSPVARALLRTAGRSLQRRLPQPGWLLEVGTSLSSPSASCGVGSAGQAPACGPATSRSYALDGPRAGWGKRGNDYCSGSTRTHACLWWGRRRLCRVASSPLASMRRCGLPRVPLRLRPQRGGFVRR